MRRSAHITLFALLVVALSLTSCVRYGFTGGSVPSEAETFSVDYFAVRAPLADPNYGQTISESLKDLLLAQTRLSLADEEGDIQYRGTVTAYRIQPVAAQEDEVSSRNRLTISVSVDYVSITEDDKDISFTITQFEDYLTDDNFEAVEADLIEAINEKLIQDIFDKTLGDW